MTSTELWLIGIAAYWVVAFFMLAYEYCKPTYSHQKLPSHYEVLLIGLWPVIAILCVYFGIQTVIHKKYYLRIYIDMSAFYCRKTEAGIKKLLFKKGLLLDKNERLTYGTIDHHVWKYSLTVDRNGQMNKVALIDKLPEGVAKIG